MRLRCNTFQSDHRSMWLCMHCGLQMCQTDRHQCGGLRWGGYFLSLIFKESEACVVKDHYFRSSENLNHTFLHFLCSPYHHNMFCFCLIIITSCFFFIKLGQFSTGNSTYGNFFFSLRRQFKDIAHFQN